MMNLRATLFAVAGVKNHCICMVYNVVDPKMLDPEVDSHFKIEMYMHIYYVVDVPMLESLTGDKFQR